jgi:membrane peptidoglycan carboxypeptidase
MTRAYAVVATGNESIEPTALRSIQGAGQQALVTKAAATSNTPAGLGETRAMMLDLLQAVVRDGTGKAARLPNVAAAGKTGTTQDYRDAWFIGFTPDLIVGVWVGNDDNTPMNKVAGGDLPAQIWHDFLTRAAPLLSKNRRPAQVPETGRAPEVAQDPGAPDAVRGVPEVIDTATLSIQGTLVRLEGVIGERGSGTLARQLARFLRRRQVLCAPLQILETYRCQIAGQNLSEIILAAGGARAAPDAPEDLLAAEDQARSGRLGLWRRMR